MKFVPELSEELQNQLEDILKSSPAHRVRQRAHAILLSSRGYSIEQISDIFTVHRNTVSQWIESFTAAGIDALPDAPKPGRPSKISQAEERYLLNAVASNPQRIGEALAALKKRRAQS